QPDPVLAQVAPRVPPEVGVPPVQVAAPLPPPEQATTSASPHGHMAVAQPQPQTYLK
ncbi:unnamed protein product, partial [Coccothraustes coccothraustes]